MKKLKVCISGVSYPEYIIFHTDDFSWYKVSMDKIYKPNWGIRFRIIGDL